MLKHITYVPLGIVAIDFVLLVALPQNTRSGIWFGVGIANFLGLAVVIALIPIYLRRILLNDQLSAVARLGWCLGIVFASLLAMPAYYRRFIRSG
jgi:hypothetical protein